MKRFCGNCNNHSAYEYPDKIFCLMRFFNNKNPIVETLWRCDEWRSRCQEECYCIEKAIEKQNK